uniref:F-box/LRR-repeat protein 15 n=1 Tax=Nothobranchius furzeri TaxID=105023 RepID=A0A8C6LAH4_NOTFU
MRVRCGRGDRQRFLVLGWSTFLFRGRARDTGQAGAARAERRCLQCQLLDLPWEDVLVPHILSHLPLQQLVSLQRVSKQFHSLVQVFLANCRTLFSCFQIGPCIPKEAFCTMLKDNKVLQNLSLQNCSDWVSDKELLPVIGQNQHLQRVDMSGCACLTRHSLVAVSLSCMHLQHLGLAHCEWVDSLSLRSLADHCGGLQSIDLTACRQLKDDAICYMARKCLKLKSLSLAVNANITDESVEEVAKNCRELERLDLTGCLRVRNQSIRTLAEYCPKLQSLMVNHCHNVTESSLDPLRKRNVVIDVEPPLQRALVLLQDVLGFAPFINLQI